MKIKNIQCIIVRLKFQKRNVLKFVNRTSPLSRGHNILHLALGFIALIYCIFFPLANNALAADWKFIAKSVTGNMYYDKSSIKEVSNNIISLYTKTVYNEYGEKNGFSLLRVMGKEPQNPDILSHELVLFEFDCVNEKYKVSSMSVYDKEGKILHSLPKVTDQVEDIPPESFADKLKKIVCNCAKSSNKKRK